MARTILIVEDNADVRTMLVRLVEREGFTVLAAPDGCSALAICTQNQPSLIVTDIEMAGIDGVELIRKLRALDRFLRVPIIVFSSAVDLGEAWRAGADDVLRKPSGLYLLPGRIQALLNRGGTR
jgi:CheY-like chemotaxis protein